MTSYEEMFDEYVKSSALLYLKQQNIFSKQMLHLKPLSSVQTQRKHPPSIQYKNISRHVKYRLLKQLICYGHSKKYIRLSLESK